MVPLNHLSQFKNNHSAKYMFLVVLSCFLTIFSGLLTQASTNEIQVNYIIEDDPLAVGASVCDTDLDDGDNVTCSLRAAIEFANINANNGTVDEINFKGLTGDDIVINIDSSLPAITEQVYIDGIDGEDHVRDITIEGGGTANINGFLFEDGSHGSKLENLVVRGFKTFNLKINDSVQTDGSSTYLIQNNYFGVDQDGSTVHTDTANYNVYFQSSDHIDFHNNTASGKRSYNVFASYTDNLSIQNSYIGTTSAGEKVVDNSDDMVVSGYGIYANRTDFLTVDNSVIGGIEGSYALRVNKGDNFNITDNRVCISPTDANLCKDGYGIQIDGVFGEGNYATGGTITGNIIDGADATDTSNGLIYGVGLSYVDNLTFSNNGRYRPFSGWDIKFCVLSLKLIIFAISL